MKRILTILVLGLVSVFQMQAAKNNYQVWGEVLKAKDGEYYLTMYKNCPATVTAEFYFQYRGGEQSELFALNMADSVAVLNDPVPVGRPVKRVVVQNVIYSTPVQNGEIYSTKDPEDPTLSIMMVDIFDLHHDDFWFDSYHRAGFYDDFGYHNLGVPVNAHYKKGFDFIEPIDPDEPDADDIDMEKVSASDLLAGVVVVAAIGVGMGILVKRNWSITDDRFPYFSVGPNTEYFFDSGLLRETMQFKYRFGNKGGFSLMADLGYSSGTWREKGMFDSGFSWSLGASLDIGEFSFLLHGKPATHFHSENFCAAQFGYRIPVWQNLGLNVNAGVAVLGYDGEYFLDYPLSLGVNFKF